MKKVIKIGVCSTVTIMVVCLALMLICNKIVVNNAKGKAFSDIDSIKYNKVGLLLGTIGIILCAEKDNVDFPNVHKIFEIISQSR